MKVRASQRHLLGMDCLTGAWLKDPHIKSCALHDLLGALPDKGDLMDDPAMDEELERL